MKLKLFTGIVLGTVLTVGLGVCFFHRLQPADKLAVSTLAKPDLGSQHKPFLANAPKLVTVTGKAAGVPAGILSPTASDWSAVHEIVDTQAGYEARLKAIHSLSGKLTDSDWNVLQPFLLKPDGLDKDQLGQVIKNELMDALCVLNPPPSSLGDVLAQIYRNQQQNEVIRDYAVQHLNPYYQQIASQPGSTNLEQSVQNVLWEAVNETGDSIGGTALLALDRLSQESPGFDQAKIAATALQMAENSNAGELTHITAFQVSAQLGTAAALPVVLQAAQNGETISVQMSAIGALGLLGGPDQIPFLNSLLQGDEARLKPAAQHALDEITARQSQLASQK